MEIPKFEPVENATMELRDGYAAAVSIQDELIRYIGIDMSRSVWAPNMQGLQGRARLLDKIRELTSPAMAMHRCDRIVMYGKPDPAETGR